MPNVGSIQRSITVGPAQYTKNTTLTAKMPISREEVLAAAKAGTLTARTDNDTGSVTAAGHGIIAGDLVSVFWAGGSRRSMVAGTIAGDVVPLDGGLGDNLPVLSTAVTIMKEVAYEIRFDGDDLVALVAQAVGIPATGIVGAHFILTADDNVEDLAIVLTAAGSWQYLWTTDDNVTNPLATDTITKVRMAHGVSSASLTMRIGAGVN